MLFIFSTPMLIRHLWQFETAVFLQRYLIRGVLFPPACFGPLGSHDTTRMVSLCVASGQGGQGKYKNAKITAVSQKKLANVNRTRVIIDLNKEQK